MAVGMSMKPDCGFGGGAQKGLVMSPGSGRCTNKRQRDEGR